MSRLVVVVIGPRYHPWAEHEVVQCLFTHIFQLGPVWNGSMGLVTASSLFDRVFGELDRNVLAPLAAAPTIVREGARSILVSIIICAIHVSRSACFAICVAQGRALSDLLRVQIEIDLHFLVATLSGLKFLPLGCGQLACVMLGEFRE